MFLSLDFYNVCIADDTTNENKMNEKQKCMLQNKACSAKLLKNSPSASVYHLLILDAEIRNEIPYIWARRKWHAVGIKI